MNVIRTALLALTTGTLLAGLVGCGTMPTAMQPAPGRAQSSKLVAQGVPPTSAFVTVQVTVVKILPADTSGLPHQNFVVQEVGGSHQTLEVNNDTQFGSQVMGLAVGEALTIRGVEYHGGNLNGIHWTHHANKTGDAGFIQTPDGHIYQ